MSRNKRENRRRILFALKVVLLILLVVLDKVFEEEIHQEAEIPARITEGLIIYLSAHLIIILVRLILVRIYLRKEDKSSHADTFIIAVTRIASILSALVFFFALLYTFDIAIKELFTSLTIVAAAIAIIFKDYIGNLINGLIIMFSGQLMVNDYVRIGNHRGKITDITLLNIHLLNDDDDHVYIPNNTVLTTDVVNYSVRKEAKVSVEFEVPLTRFTNNTALENYLLQQLQPFDIIQGSNRLRIVNLTKDFALCRFSIRLSQPNRDTEKRVRQTLLAAVADARMSEMISSNEKR